MKSLSKIQFLASGECVYVYACIPVLSVPKLRELLGTTVRSEWKTRERRVKDLLERRYSCTQKVPGRHWKLHNSGPRTQVSQSKAPFCLHTLILTVYSLFRYVFWDSDIPSLTPSAAKLADEAGSPNSFVFLHSTFSE